MSRQLDSRVGEPVNSSTRILEAALALTAERGVSGMTLAGVAREAGLSRQSVYLIFGSRAGLLTEMTRHKDRTSGISRRFVRALQAPSAADALERTVATWFDYIPDIYPIALALSGAAASDPEAAAAWKDRTALIRGTFLSVCRRLEREGALADGWTADRAADFIYAQAHFSTWHHLVKERGWTPADAARRVTSVLAAGLLRKQD